MPLGRSALVVLRRARGGEGDTFTDRPGRRVTVLVETDQITIPNSDYGRVRAWSARHVHREPADAFLVMDGEFTFHFHDGSHALPGGTLLVMPPNVVHGFDNDSDASARCFNFHLRRSASPTTCGGRTPSSTSSTHPGTGPTPDLRS
jgi:quercetin dioxygenase-like cupin family protein